MSADAIRAALAKMTPGEWFLTSDGYEARTGKETLCGNDGYDMWSFDPDDLAGIVTLRNLTGPTLDALEAALAAEKARADKAEALLQEIVPPKVREKVMSKSAIPHHIRLATAQAIFDAIRAALENRDGK